MPRRMMALVAIVGTSLFLFSCSGDDGAVGPRGPAGADGTAYVKVFEFGSVTFTGSTNYSFEEAQSVVDESMVLAYYNPSNEAATAWYPAPGLGSTGAYMVRTFWFQINPSPSTYSFGVRLLTPDGAGGYPNEVTFTKFKIVLAPASEIISLSLSGFDLNDYTAVKDHFGLED